MLCYGGGGGLLCCFSDYRNYLKVRGAGCSFAQLVVGRLTRGLYRTCMGRSPRCCGRARVMKGRSVGSAEGRAGRWVLVGETSRSGELSW